MHFVAVCLDNRNSLDLRLANRAAHLDFLKAHSKNVQVCGPLLADDGETMIGSLLLIEATSREEVDRILSQDPYRKANLFQSVSVRRWRCVIGQDLSAKSDGRSDVSVCADTDRKVA